MERKKILVTGANGYIGKALLKYLDDDTVRCLVRKKSGFNAKDVVYGDLMDYASLERALYNVDVVVHLAAVTHGNSDDFYRVNVLGTKNLIAASRKKKIKKFIFISSMAATRKYPDDYGRSKKQAEELLKESGLQYVILRPSMIYGGKSRAVDGFVAYLKKIPFIIPVVGKGGAILQPVYIEDVANVIARSIDNDKAVGKTYELLGNTRISMNYFIDFVSSRLNIKKIKLHIPEAVVLLGVDFFTLFYKNFPIKREFIKSFNYDVNGSNREAETDFSIKFKRLSQSWS